MKYCSTFETILLSQYFVNTLFHIVYGSKFTYKTVYLLKMFGKTGKCDSNARCVNHFDTITDFTRQSPDAYVLSCIDFGVMAIHVNS